VEERSTGRWLLVVVMAASRVFVGGGDHSRDPAAAAMVREMVVERFVQGFSARFDTIREEGEPAKLTNSMSRSRFDSLGFYAHSLFVAGFSTAAPVVPVLAERRSESREEVLEA
jgi:hypothetical protein